MKSNTANCKSDLFVRPLVAPFQRLVQAAFRVFLGQPFQSLYVQCLQTASELREHRKTGFNANV